uniref:DegQ (SacQ) family n=1 Tax=Myoviridae sp. ctvns3 TaxID=2825204 RepID=A0A8S5PEH2_9CAUD|nr:MAG TPA: DegQ (SacQ) family [Myoviridae sp. ctvns3]
MQTCQLKSLQNVKKSIDKFTNSNYIIIKVCKTQT